MRTSAARHIARFFSAVILFSIVLQGLFGQPAQVAYALTTTVNDVPGAAIAIPDANCGAPITRTINVAANVVIADINVGVNVNHATRSQIRVTLTSPAGTTVVLIPGAGFGSPASTSPDNYDNYDVLLDDTSVGSIYDNSSDATGFPYFDRNARPVELLSAFKGENAMGNWTLQVCDSLAGTTGTYNRSQLTIVSADPNTISGTVFTDYNDNGMRGSGDTGVSGVTVTAYDSTNAVVATTTTNATGNYTLAVPDGTQVRVEFSTIPANLRPGSFGRDSGTTVQFVTSPVAGADLGLSKPDEYCQNNPFLVMPCYINGDPLAGGTASAASVMYSIPNSAYGRADNTITKSLATGAQIGSTWGLAYQRETNTVFAGALAKRHAGFGPLGGGGIYAIVVNPVTGAQVSVSNFLDIDSLAGIDDGPLDDTARGLPAVSTTPNTDPAAWDAVGKESIGDMDIGSSDDTLWLVNLADRTLYSLFIGIPAVAPSAYTTATPITLPAGATACAASDVRPWAVEVYQGNVYVGVVCSAESTQNVADLRAYVLSTSESAPGTWSLVFEFGLDYPRGVVSADGPGYPAEWRPWSNVFTSIWCGTCGGSGLGYGNQIIYPQPILSDIEFDTDGDMILGFMDRAGHQTGEANYTTSAVTTSFTLYDFTAGYAATPVTIAAGTTLEGTSGGDMLRVCNVAGTFVLENNATCGGIMTGGAGSAPAQGPGGGEYYWQDMFPPTDQLNNGSHNEVTLGGLVLVPGTDEVVTSVFDPFAIRSGGVTWFSNVTGARMRAYEIFGQTNDASRFGKAAGIGDVEGFCYSAPIEIGNRIWQDDDGDGIQDAGESPIAGVTVELYQGGTLIATAVTDANGSYYFSSGPGTSTANQIYLIDELNPNSSYEIRIPNAQGGSQQAPLAGLVLTTPDADQDQRDSDASYNDDNAVISVTTGAAGNNDHTFDFGFTATYSLGNRVWFDTNNSATLDGAEVGISGVRVELYQDNGTTPGVWDAGDTFLSFDTTDASGYYRFDNLAAGDYVALIPGDNFRDVGVGDTVPGNPLSGYWSSSTSIAVNGAIADATANDPDTTIVDNDDNGRTTLLTPSRVDYVASAAVTLGPGSPEPTTDNDPATNPEAGEAPNNRSDRTVDFGFYQVDIGNLAFVDVNGDGDYDAGTDTLLPGATVQLFASDGVTEIPVGVDGILGTADDAVGGVTTDAFGVYNFSGLPQGDYIIRATPPTGYTSTVDTSNSADTANPDINADNNDNGIGLAGGQVSSGILSMIPGEVLPNIAVDNTTGRTTDLTVDFGFVAAYSLGNRVWFDTDNNSTRDAGELGVPGVVVELYSASGGPVLATTTTDANGYYRFDNLVAGDYIVRLPADNFTVGGASDALVGYWSSGTSRLSNGTLTETAAPDADGVPSDVDDNGTLQAGAVDSLPVTLGPGSTEPTLEPDAPLGQGAVDNRADMTVDFGFYTMTLGNQVWGDINDNGLLDGGEIGINGVTVNLLSGDGTTVIATTTTTGNGDYSFTGLPAGDYIVQIAAAEFNAGGTLEGTTSSTGGGGSPYEPAPDADGDTTDSDDNGSVNGVLGGGGDIRTSVVTLTPGAEANSVPATGVTNEPRVDFGIVTPPYSLGNRVWFDTNNNSLLDGGEFGVAGVTVELYSASGGALLATTTTDATGYYRFDNLPAGDYVVVLPAGNFGAGGALDGYWSSATTMDGAGNIAETAAPDADNDVDNDDNGTFQTSGTYPGAVISSAVTLGPLGSEPTGDNDSLPNPGVGEAANDHSNRTVDFGFYRLQLGDLVFEDVDNDGLFTSGTDTPLAGAVVTLYAADGTTQIPVGPDGVLGTADDGATGVTTGAGGAYLFSGLPQGDYIVRVTPPAGYQSTIDSADQTDNDNPNTNADDNDNGDGVASGQVSSAIVTLTPGSAGAALNNVVTANTGTTHNPTVDFGFVQTTSGAITKTLLSSNQAFTTDPNVAIGEIVTYRVVVTIPTGTFTNAQLVDTMEQGLSFMDCTAITPGTLTTNVVGGFPAVCAGPTVDDAGGGAPTDVNRRVTFNFGTLTNTGAPQSLTIDYRAVVLDSAANVSGVDLDNSAVWSSSAGTLPPVSTTVTIVEPDVSILKTSSASTVSVGSVITLTLTINHTAASQTDAYDLVVTDVLPVELDFVPATLNCNVGAQSATTCAYTPGTRTIQATWSNFALGAGNGQITFDVTVLAIPATNVADVAWTSLPGVPPSPPGNPPGQQNANIFSTERDYDPGSPINVYGSSSTLVLGVTAGGGSRGIPAGARAPDTGFAPNVKTDLSNVPLESYDSLAGNIWFEIPSLGLKTSIVGVPIKDGGWNVAWLGKQAGWLEGSAYPTWNGNSVITGHVYLSNGLPGPFVNLNQLKYGDTIIVHANGQKYTYEIRTNQTLSPTDSSVFKHEEKSWLTFITCKEYDEKTNTYRKRVVVRAVLVKVEADK